MKHMIRSDGYSQLKIDLILVETNICKELGLAIEQCR